MTFWDGTRWVPDAASPPATSGRGRRFLGASAEALLITGLIFGLIAGTTLAAKGGGGKGGGRDAGSLSLVMVDDPNGDSVPNHGETVTFDVSTTATDEPFVNVRCYQGGSFVYDGWAGFYPAAWFGRNFTLSSTSWLSGEADCNARLVAWSRNGRERVLAQHPFRVEA